MDSESKTSNMGEAWKAKYSELVAESDRLAKDREVTEKLLCRTIIRLTLAANGLDPALDPHLKKLRTLLKKGVNNDRLREQLDAVSESLLRLEGDSDSVEEAFDVTALFGFLSHCAQNNSEKEAIGKLMADHEGGQFSNLNALFLAASRLLDGGVDADSEPGLLDRLFGRAKKSEKTDGFDNALRQELLERLLDSLDVPVYLRHQFEALKKQASANAGDSTLFLRCSKILSRCCSKSNQRYMKSSKRLMNSC